MSDPPPDSCLKCAFCHRGSDVEDVCGQLHSEITREGMLVVAHHKCMQYSATLVQYKFDHFGGFKIAKVQDEMKRAKSLKCHICKKFTKKIKIKGGASAGCALRECRRSFHYYCAKTDDTTVTKRLVVSFKSKNKKTILYRVFCCAEHEAGYRANLKSYLAAGNEENTSDLSEDEEDEESHIQTFLMSQDAENTSLVSLSDREVSPRKKQGLCEKKARISAPKKSISKTSTLCVSVTKADNNVDNNSFSTPVTNKVKTAKKNMEKTGGTNLSPNVKLQNLYTIKSASPAKIAAKSSPPKEEPNSKVNPTVSLSSEVYNFDSDVSLNVHHNITKSPNISKKSPGTKCKSPRGFDSSIERSKLRSPPAKRVMQESGDQAASEKKKKISIPGSSESKRQSVVTLSKMNGLPNTACIDTDEENGDDSDETISPDKSVISNSDLEEEGSKGSSQFRANREFVLCVPAVSTLSDELRSAITREVYRDAGSVVSIRMWHDLHPNIPQHEREIIFLIKDLAQCIQSKDKDSLIKFLLNSEYLEKKINSEYKIQTKMVNDLEDPMIENQILEKTWSKASQLLDSVSGGTALCIGSIFPIESCRFLKVTINNALDQDGTIRAQWPADPAAEKMTLWDNKTGLCSEPSTTKSLHCEVTRLEKWLTNQEPPLCPVNVYPQESVFRISEQSTDLVERLRKKTDNARAAVGSTLLVFQRVDTELINFDRYFKKVLETMDSTRLSNLVVLLPTAHVKSKANRDAVVSLLPGNLQSKVEVFTAVNPAFMPCTWLVLQITCTSTTKDKVKTSSTLSSPAPSPSSSKENRKRRKASLQSSTPKYLKKSKK
ncbi:uncharacterized protein LOC121378359 isoform X2 [Gigantopelta aegis]|uniref:uncharacterized protein LOC121378359 isoform X2 n=1 Tax=Gigantopelta aegis TaxID=1735272 RepID=UPI001B888042|nr:uncharacterized protein LOC121378359 isoform X2 [Gigantopelta aegis]